LQDYFTKLMVDRSLSYMHPAENKA